MDAKRSILIDYVRAFMELVQASKADRELGAGIFAVVDLLDHLDLDIRMRNYL